MQLADEHGGLEWGDISKSKQQSKENQDWLVWLERVSAITYTFSLVMALGYAMNLAMDWQNTWCGIWAMWNGLAIYAMYHAYCRRVWDIVFFGPLYIKVGLPWAVLLFCNARKVIGAAHN